MQQATPSSTPALSQHSPITIAHHRPRQCTQSPPSSLSSLSPWLTPLPQSTVPARHPNPTPPATSSSGAAPRQSPAFPLSTSCTHWTTSSPKGLPGTCQALNLLRQKNYTLYGGWSLMDDYEERVERCIAVPRRRGSWGLTCDGSGIRWPLGDACGDEGMGCVAEGKVCFWDREGSGHDIQTPVTRPGTF